MKYLRIFHLICLELGFLFSWNNSYHKSDSILLWVICCSLPLAQIKIENEPEHGISQSGMFPTINSVPSGDRTHAGHLQSLGFRGYWDLGLLLSDCQAFQLSAGEQGHESELETREAEVHAVVSALSAWVGLRCDKSVREGWHVFSV